LTRSYGNAKKKNSWLNIYKLALETSIEGGNDKILAKIIWPFSACGKGIRSACQRSKNQYKKSLLFVF
jgi:hypothetical protein